MKSNHIVLVDEKAIRDVITEVMQRGPIDVYVPDVSTNVNPVVAPDAAVTDPVNVAYVPQDTKELTAALPGVVKNVEKSDVPKVYKAIKQVVDRVESDKMDKNNVVEDIVRKHVRKIVKEAVTYRRRLQKIFEAPVKGTEEYLKDEPVPEPHNYNKLYVDLYKAIDNADDDELIDVLLRDIESKTIMQDAVDALMAIAKGDPDAQKIAIRIRDAMPSEISDLASDYMNTIVEKGIEPNPTPPVRGGVDDTMYDKTPEDLEQLKQRDKIEKERVAKMHGTIAADMGVSPSTVVNIEHTGRVKMVLYNMWQYDKHPGDQETFQELADVNMFSNKDPALELGWSTKIVAAALSGDPPAWLSDEDKQMFKRLQKGYELFAAAVEEFGETFDLSDDEAILFALETDPLSGNKNQQEHKFFSETFDYVASKYLNKGDKDKDVALQLPKWQGLRSFLIYWGQDADKLLDKVTRIYNVAAIEKRRARRREEEELAKMI